MVQYHNQDIDLDMVRYQTFHHHGCHSYCPFVATPNSPTSIPSLISDTNLFFSSIILSFQEYLMNRIVHYIPNLIGLTFFIQSNFWEFSQFLHVSGIHSSLLLSSIDIPQLNHPPTGGLLDVSSIGLLQIKLLEHCIDFFVDRSLHFSGLSTQDAIAGLYGSYVFII